MAITDELRRMLDERGVEWMPIAWNPKRETFYHTSNGVGFCADEYADGVKIYTDATITPEQAVEATLGPAVPPPPAPDQPPYDVLLNILASEWGIDASWDGLRRFWCVELNDEGVRKRDELQAENAKLRELVRIAGTYCVNGLCGKDDGCPLYLGKPYCALPDRMRELGMEVE